MTRTDQDEARAALEEVLRLDDGRMLATLIAWSRDFQLAEDSLQDAIEAALRAWPGALPDSPQAWLVNAARRKAIDRLRRQRTRETKAADVRVLHELERRGDVPDLEAIADDRLRLIMTCCHPALAQHAQVALTLKTIAGWTTEDIARALLTSSATLAQRLVRAKRKIREEAIPYEVPGPEHWPERLDAVLQVIYLMYNQGYDAVGQGQRDGARLSREAMHLAALALSLMPDEPETMGLLALLMLHDARREARLDAQGAYVPLDQHDRALWGHAQIVEGTALLGQALIRRRPGPFQIQAAISALHCSAPSAEATDWGQIAALYGELLRYQPTAVVAINRAVALCRAQGPEAALELLRELEAGAELEHYQPYYAARAYILHRAGRLAEAGQAYARAIALSESAVEQDFLRRRMRECMS